MVNKVITKEIVVVDIGSKTKPLEEGATGVAKDSLAGRIRANASLVLYGKLPHPLGRGSNETLWKFSADEKFSEDVLKKTSLPQSIPSGAEVIVVSSLEDSPGTKAIRYYVKVDQPCIMRQKITMSYLAAVDESLEKLIIDHVSLNPSEVFSFFNSLFSDFLSEKEVTYTANMMESRNGNIVVVDMDKIREGTTSATEVYDNLARLFRDYKMDSIKYFP